MLKILQARLQQYMNWELPDVQTGFKKGRGTRDQIANVHWTVDKAREFQKNIYFFFINYTSLWLCRSQQTLENGDTILWKMGIPDHLTCLLRKLYAGQEETELDVDQWTCSKLKSVLITQSCQTLCDPMDCSPPGSSIHGILQSRILEWVATSFSRGIFLTRGLNLGLPHCGQTLYWLSPQPTNWKRSTSRLYIVTGAYLTYMQSTLWKMLGCRDKSMNLWTPYLWQRRQGYTMEKRQRL